MFVFRVLNKKFSPFNHVQTNCACFVTEHLKLAAKKLPNLRNSFTFTNEFRKVKGVVKKTKLASSDLIAVENETRAIKAKKKTTFSPLQYQGEIRKKTTFSPLQYQGEILYGIHPVYLALLQRKRQLFQLFLRKDKEDSNESSNTSRKEEIERMARAQGIPICNVDTKGMKYLTFDVVHQGVCLDAGYLPLKEWNEINRIENQSSPNMPLWLVLDEILDPMNVGAIVRSAHYFGVSELFIVKGNSCRLSPTVSKASSGALEVMNIHQIEKLENFIQVRKTQGWNIISTVAYCEDQNGTLGPVVDITDLKVSKPTILILGNEGRGISTEIQKLCDSFVSIYPTQNLHQGIDSLNVSVAAGVILYSLSTKVKAVS